MTKKYGSDALEALHKTAVGLHRAGLVDRKTMRDFDASCLTTVEKLSAKEIADLRKRSGGDKLVSEDESPNSNIGFIENK